MCAPSTEELLLSNEKGGWCLGRCFNMNHSTFTRGANMKHGKSLYKPFIFSLTQARFRKTDRNGLSCGELTLFLLRRKLGAVLFAIIATDLDFSLAEIPVRVTLEVCCYNGN